MNKYIIKNVFDSKINKNEIYNNILNQRKKINYFKYSIIPICIIIIICLTNLSIRTPIEPNNVININIINNKYNDFYDISFNTTYIDKEILLEKFPWITILIDKAISTNFQKLIEEDREGYLMYFNYSDMYIEIFISSNVEEKPRCISNFFGDSFKISNINELDFKLYKNEDRYFALFNINNLNYDIEIKNINEDDFIKLLEFITKNN